MTRESNSQYEPSHRHSRAFWFFMILIAVILAGGGMMLHKYNLARQTAKKIYSPTGITKARDADATLKQGKPISVLLLGTDTGALGRSFKGRTDTMIIMVLNPKSQKMTLVSLPRDAEVTVAGFEDQAPYKINAAYAFGGPGTAVKTVQNYLNVPIDYYMTINMGGLENMVNAVGGIDLKPIRTFSYGGCHFVKGKMTHMNGKMALQYCRMRHEDPLGDYGRQTRQRQVMMKLASKSTNIKSLLSNQFMHTIGKQAQTDLSFNDLKTLGLKYRKATHHMKSTHLQGNGTDINGQDFEVVPQTEKQRVTDLLRKSLELQPAQTGTADSSAQNYQAGSQQQYSQPANTY